MRFPPRQDFAGQVAIETRNTVHGAAVRGASPLRQMTTGICQSERDIPPHPFPHPHWGLEEWRCLTARHGNSRLCIIMDRMMNRGDFVRHAWAVLFFVLTAAVSATAQGPSWISLASVPRGRGPQTLRPSVMPTPGILASQNGRTLLITFTNLSVGDSYGVFRSSRLVEENWTPAGSFVATSTETNWPEAMTNASGALAYMLVGDPICAPPCAHGGCQIDHTCVCEYGWTGSDCTTPTCESLNYCSGHGSCMDYETCSCDSGWQGDPACSTPSCEDVSDCNGNGFCIGPNTCWCGSGWIGSDCSTPTCESLNYCSSHGSCVDYDICSCDSGWNGDAACFTPSCEDVNYCSGNGSCVGPNDCTCDSGWSLPDCSSYNCDDVGSCSGNGSCDGPNTCTCDLGWGGVACDTPTCEGESYCSGHGDCVDYETCSCYSGWGGSDCSCVDSGQSCASNGECCSGVCLEDNTCQ